MLTSCHVSIFDTHACALLSQFSKWEGLTYDPKQKKIYTAISYQRQGMMDFANR